MNYIQALVLGLIQGVSEFLPISSSGHLILVPRLFGWTNHSLAFDTVLHLGTALALLVYFHKYLFVIAKDFVIDLVKHNASIGAFSRNGKMGLMIVIGTIPAGLFGVLFNDYIENVFRSVPFVSLFLVLGSFLMYRADKFKMKKPYLNYFDSFLVGLFQSLALLPGISRSGASISGGMILGLSREDATKFSFLLSIPIILMAGVFQIHSSNLNLLDPNIIIGFASSFISGILTVKFLMNFVKNNNLNVFIIYRLIVALLLLLFVL